MAHKNKTKKYKGRKHDQFNANELKYVNAKFTTNFLISNSKYNKEVLRTLQREIL
jgi:hypothetical protein